MLSQAWRVRGQTSLEPFYRDKLFLSVHHSLQHRKTALSDATALTDTILERVYPLTTEGIINAQNLSQLVHAVLEAFDSNAAVHYQSFHPLHI